ncbi:MAG: TIGR01777 family oxidoreductase [Bacteroidetes bacterium]|nr:TIGR01777 family oxidoreductase [Bacteroidota bacterium]
MMEKQWVVVTGGTGLVGRTVCKQLKHRGYHVRVLSRHQAPLSEGVDEVVQWDPMNQVLPAQALRHVHAVVHLAGAPIAQRWTAKSRHEILNSRTKSTQTLTHTMASLPLDERPRVFLCASAVGIYPSTSELLDETAPVGPGFAAEVVQAWEAEAIEAEALGCRTVRIRIGLVLSAEGGILGSLKPLFSLGLGSAIGSGNQWQSWIHIEDLSRMMLWSLRSDEVQGVYNGVSSNPVTNRTFSKELAHALHRPFFLPAVPSWVLKWVFGEMSSVLLASNRVTSAKVEEAGFEFQHPNLEEAMANLYPR